MSLALVFQAREVATLPQLQRWLKRSRPAVFQRLHAVGYHSSYTHNGRFYTLAHIPKFDRNRIWMYRKIGFTSCNNLFDLVVHCVEQSPRGYSAEELSGVVGTRVANQVRLVVRGGRLKRIRFTDGHVYFSMDPSRFQAQLARRRKTWQEAEPIERGVSVGRPAGVGGLSHHEIVLVLSTMINHPKWSLKKLRENLRREKHLDVPEDALHEMIEAYGIKRYKKKVHRLLRLAIDHLAACRGDSDRWQNPRKTIPLVPWQEVCPVCDEELESYKTQSQTVYSVEYGNFTAQVKYRYCPTHAYDPKDDESIVSYRSEPLARIVGPRRRYAYDVMTYLGVSRFLQGRQLQEIVPELSERYRIPISPAQAGRLSDEFLIRLSCLHASHRFHLKRLIRERGGYVLHIDASCEKKSSTVFVGIDGVSGWVLLSEKIPSEREEFIVPALRALRRGYGRPRGIMRDMGLGMERAAHAVFKGVSQRICHYHFLKDVGKDMLYADYQGIRSLVVDQKVTPQLNGLRRDLLTPLKRHRPNQEMLEAVLSGRCKMTRSVFRDMDILLVVTTVDWVLNYYRDGSGLGFPFDCPYIHFYERCLKAYRLLVHLQRLVSSTSFKDARLDTLVFALAKVCDPAYEAAKELQEEHTIYRAKRSEFDRLRTVMRFYGNGKAPLSQEMGYRSFAEMRAANKGLKKYLRTAKQRLSTTREDARREALNVIVDHLERHWDYLMAKKEPEGIWGDRTNNCDEGLQRDCKRRLRLLTGKKDISQEFDRLGAYMPLVQNLENPSYVEAVIGSIDNLAEAFSELDPELVEKHTEKFYESRWGVAYKLRASLDPIAVLENCQPRSRSNG
jgi:hypothetical protein